MAEYFESGSASDVNDLLGKLRNAMTLHGGWTQQHLASDGTSGGQRAHLSKGNLKVNFRSGFNNELPTAYRNNRLGGWNWSTSGYSIDYLCMNLSSDFNFSNPWNGQPGAPGSGEALAGMAFMLTAFGSISRYWLFLLEDPDAVFLIVENRPDKFEYLAFGNLSLIQTVESGGEWFFGSRSMSHNYDQLRPPLESTFYNVNAGSQSTTQRNVKGFVRLVDSRYAASNSLSGWDNCRTYGVGGSYGSSSVLSTDLTTSYIEKEGRSILYPIAAIKGNMILGYIPHVARISMQPYMPGEQVLGVGETYLAFPGHKRSVPWTMAGYGSSPYPASTEEYNFHGTGIAIRRP